MIPYLVRTSVDKELTVAAAAFKAVSYILTSGSKLGREVSPNLNLNLNLNFNLNTKANPNCNPNSAAQVGGLVTAAKLCCDTMIEIMKEA